MPDPAFANRYSLLKRAIVVWFILIAVEIVHGVLRFIFLVPYVGDFRARQIGVFTGSVLNLAVAYLFVGWLQSAATKSLMMVGMLWLVLTVAFEFSFGHFVFGSSWKDLASDYDLLHGGLLPIGMLMLAFSPIIAARFHNLALPVLWLVVLAMLIGVVRIPGSGLDLYFKDIYVAVPKFSMIVLILVLFAAPLLAFSIKRLRSRHK